MSKIGILAVDSKYPNLALMKISSYHKKIGDEVSWYTPFSHYDIVYMSKIFTFTEDYQYSITNADVVCKGGTGYDIKKTLPYYIDRMQPDYSLYPDIGENLAYGFLTRGCPNHCKWCVVPEKEGKVAPYMDIEEVSQDRQNVILMDNNILASEYGITQLEKIVRLGLHVDFNQALDARLVTDDVARILAKIKWIRYIRFGCDTPKQVAEVERAASLIDKYGYMKEYFLYTILMDFKESFDRVNYWRDKHRFTPFAQPYRDFNSKKQIIPQWQSDLARWCNRRWLFKKTTFEDYEPRKGFKCKAYFDYSDET